MARLVVIEDDPRIRAALGRALGERGHVVALAATGLAGLQCVVDQAADAVVLDLGLPDLDGREILRMIRAVSAVPVIVATARGDETEIVRCLDAGADDYIVKPFSSAQMEARIRAVLRRSQAAGPHGAIQVGGLRIDTRARAASIEGRPLALTRKEFDVLAFLAARPGVVVRKAELLAEVWRQPFGGGDKTVDVHLSWLRRKLGESAADHGYLRTIRGVGVKLVDPAQPEPSTPSAPACAGDSS